MTPTLEASPTVDEKVLTETRDEVLQLEQEIKNLNSADKMGQKIALAQKVNTPNSAERSEFETKLVSLIQKSRALKEFQDSLATNKLGMEKGKDLRNAFKLGRLRIFGDDGQKQIIKILDRGNTVYENLLGKIQNYFIDRIGGTGVNIQKLIVEISVDNQTIRDARIPFRTQ